uniref:GRIP domain-containing protein n=1 Tax=Parascaris equorum TaxID=6256 RepID=A0A914S0B5_PAREQ
MLVQKFKRLRKCVLSRRHGDNDDDRQSSFGGSDCSAESSISLDTITENFGESDNAVDLLATITRLQDQIIGLQAKCERLERELSDTKENNELLEFQLLENNENMKHEFEESLAKKEGIDKVVETDMWIPEEQCDLSNQIPTTLTFDQICDLKRDLLDLRKLAYLDDFQRSIAHRAQLFIESLENQMLEAEAKNNLQMKNYEAKEAEREKLINDLQAQIEESYSKQKKKKENAAKIIEIENAKEALSNRLTAIEQEKECLLRRMAEIEHERDELIKYKGQMHSQNEKLHKQMEQIQNEKVTLMKMVTDAEVKQQTDRLSQLRREKATVEQENAKLLEDLNEIVKLRRQLAEFETKLEDRSKIENDFAQLREYSQQLEKQFSTQSHLIDALKEKIIQHKKFTDFLSAATDDGEHSCEDIEEKLEHFCESQQDEGNRESTNLLRRLIRWLSNSSEALASLDERHDLSDDEIEAARRKQIIKNTRG